MHTCSALARTARESDCREEMPRRTTSSSVQVLPLHARSSSAQRRLVGPQELCGILSLQVPAKPDPELQLTVLTVLALEAAAGTSAQPHLCSCSRATA